VDMLHTAVVHVCANSNCVDIIRKVKVQDNSNYEIQVTHKTVLFVLCTKNKKKYTMILYGKNVCLEY